MPTKRLRRTRNRLLDLTEYQRDYLLDRAPPEPPASDHWWHFVEAGADHDGSPYRSAHLLWRENRDELLATWLRDHPGHRPSIWWEVDAPRQPLGRFPRAWYDGKLQQPRQRLGGIGTPRFEVLADVARYACGLPLDWVTVHDFRVWPSLRGKAQAFDPADPPMFESQASYLARHGLLAVGEQARLRVEDWQLEAAELERADNRTAI